MHRKSMCTMLVLCLSWLLVSCAQPAMQSGSESRPQSQSTPVVPLSHITPTPPVDRPERLIVPAIQVDAVIEPVGLNASGDLDTPSKNPWFGVGWYNAGPVPGERGSAVIDGHLDRTGGSPAIFWYLRNMKVGDVVTVVTVAGKRLDFHVTRTALYTPQDAPLQGIFGDTSGTYLNLITCAGDWIASENQTTLRMVVYTMLG